MQERAARLGWSYRNTASNSHTFVSGGYNSVPGPGYGATLVGSGYNTAHGNFNFLGGGFSNVITAAGTNGTLGGGLNNRVGDMHGFLGGGAWNVANGWGSAVAGGFDHQATANHATVPGGAKARAQHVGAFVWSGVDTVTTVSTNARSFTVRSPGGARFITAVNNGLTGVIAQPNATAWTVLSARENKTDFRPIKPREILAKLAAVPVISWQYKHDPSRRYIGPTSCRHSISAITTVALTSLTPMA